MLCFMFESKELVWTDVLIFLCWHGLMMPLPDDVTNCLVLPLPGYDTGSWRGASSPSPRRARSASKLTAIPPSAERSCRATSTRCDAAGFQSTLEALVVRDMSTRCYVMVPLYGCAAYSEAFTSTGCDVMLSCRGFPAETSGSCRTGSRSWRRQMKRCAYSNSNTCSKNNSNNNGNSTEPQ